MLQSYGRIFAMSILEIYQELTLVFLRDKFHAQNNAIVEALYTLDACSNFFVYL